jgi:UDP-glucose 4-epimerase
MNLLATQQVAITGANGFIGTSIINRLARDQVRAIVIGGTATPGQRSVSGRLQHLTAEAWQDAGVDRIDTLIHLAAFTPKNQEDGNDAWAVVENNVVATQRLLETLPQRPQRIIFGSTLDVYASLAEQPLTEESALGPTSLYGASKLLAEGLLMDYCRRVGTECVILRYGHIFGPGEQAYSKLIPATIARILQGSAPVILGEGNAVRDYLYVDDAAEATVRAATAQITGSEQVINVARGASVSIKTVVQSILSLAKADLNISYVAALEAPSIEFDTRRMRQILGTWELTPLETGLHSEIGFMRSQMMKAGAVSTR